MSNEKLKARAASGPWWHGIDILFRHGNAVGEPLTMKEGEPGEMVEPTVRLEREQAQVLMDDLWACGIRPTEGMGSAGSLRATEKHLKDMRTIAFSALKINDKNA